MLRACIATVFKYTVYVVHVSFWSGSVYKDILIEIGIYDVYVMWYQNGEWGVNMVKVYKCHNFKSQNVIQVDNEPVALFAHQDKLFVATQNCCVFIYKFLANQKHQKTNAFATEARAQQLLFNNTG